MAREVQKVIDFLGPDGEHWTQGTYGRDEAGVAIDEQSPKAVKFCLKGACRVLYVRDSAFSIAVFEQIFRRVITGPIIDFNDTHSWPEVQEALQKALEASTVQ